MSDTGPMKQIPSIGLSRAESALALGLSDQAFDEVGPGLPNATVGGERVWAPERLAEWLDAAEATEEAPAAAPEDREPLTLAQVFPLTASIFSRPGRADGPEAAPTLYQRHGLRDPAVLEGWVRDEIVRLGKLPEGVTIGDLADATGLHRGDASKQLDAAADHGTIAVIGDWPEARERLRGRPPTVWGWVRPNRSGMPPAARGTGLTGKGGAAAVAGTGRGSGFARKETRAFIKDIVAGGGKVVGTGTHPQIKAPDGSTVMVAGSPSDHRSRKNERARLKRAGVDL